MFALIKLPIAAPITVAFQVNMNMAPAPYTKENSTENAITLKLLKNILPNMPRLCTALPETWLLIACIVPICLSKSRLIVDAGRKEYHNAHAIVIPMNMYIKKDIALLCSLNIAYSFSIIISLLSSSFIVL